MNARPGRRANGAIMDAPEVRGAILVVAVLWGLLSPSSLAVASSPPHPHIIFMLADDLGFNDVAFRGSNQIPTPNIDALAYSGLVLDRYYVTPLCTPSRSAIMTGKHPIHNGMQHTVLYAAEPRGLPLSETLLPQHLKRLGYATHLVGKWHLGFFMRNYTPTFRGFDTHLGFWSGHHDYFDHTAVETPFWGLDMRRGLEPAWELHGQYDTRLFTREAVRLIRAHNASHPMLLVVAHAAVHSANPYSPLPAPDETVATFDDIKDYNRRRFAAMMSLLDESVGGVVEALDAKNMLKDSIIVFSTDNGGPAAGFNLNAASNWPLRGVKNTLWEGGVRGVGVLWSPKLGLEGRIAPQLMHVTDWLPTLYSAAGGDVRDLGEIDGLDVWGSLVNDTASPRAEVLHNIDDIFGNAALTVGDWKIVQGATYGGEWDSWYGPSGREDPERPYDVGQVVGSRVGRGLRHLGSPLLPDRVRSLRASAEIQCTVPDTNTREQTSPCLPLQSPCLFNVRDDPCEYTNLADRFPGILCQLKLSLTEYNATAVPPTNLPWDPRADPRFWDHTWTNFGDYSLLSNAVS